MPQTDSNQSSPPFGVPLQQSTRMTEQSIFSGPIYRVGDRISSDDILSPLYLSFDLNQPDERKILADYAFQAIENTYGQFKKPGAPTSPYKMILAGHQFGHGSARPHAPIALAEAGIVAILAQSYANGFYRTCVNEGSILPLIMKTSSHNTPFPDTGSIITINIDQLIVTTQENQHWSIEPPGVTLDIYNQGGLLTHTNQATPP